MSPLIKKALYAIAALAFAAMIIFSFLQNFEYVEKTQWQPLTGEAKTNPLYASQLFLRRMGIPAETLESLQNLTQLPSTNTVIVISESRQTLRPEQFSQLVDWVRRGGHLVISGIADWNTFLATTLPSEDQAEEEPVYYDEPDEAVEPGAGPDPFQDFLNVEMRDNIRFDKGEAETIRIKGSERPLALGPDYYRAIVPSANNEKNGLEQIAINQQNVIIRQRVDDGLITLVSDFDFISNYKLATYDHAQIFWQIVRGKAAILEQPGLRRPDAVWLIHSDETTSLLVLIWKYFWALVITLALLLLVWVLRVSRRFGPLISKASEDRRNLLEHIDASGNYYWKQQGHTALLDSTRSAAQQQLAKRIPGWHALSQQNQSQLLAKRLRLDISEQQLLHTLYGDISHSPHEFTETIKQLEHIRTHL
ncbi:MAG: DUF4350 domain-containing protein [Leucothrix sp.]